MLMVTATTCNIPSVRITRNEVTESNPGLQLALVVQLCYMVNSENFIKSLQSDIHQVLCNPLEKGWGRQYIKRPMLDPALAHLVLAHVTI